MPAESPVDERQASSIEEYFPFAGSIRSAQEKALAAIQQARDTHKKFVLLELPTGTGKSAVGIAAAKWASTWGTGGYILSTQKTLTAQYMRDFANKGLVEFPGRSSYTCQYFSTKLK